MADWINTYHGNYNRSGRNGAYKYIAVHYTGAQSPDYPNALNNCKYFAGGNRNASAHYFIDNAGVWEYLDPDSYCAWHVGDGGGRYGITNSNAIGIEVCQMGDKPFTEAEIGHLTRLVGHLQQKYGIPASNVVRHYDASRKSCPEYYAKRDGEWQQLKARITSGQTDPNYRPVLSQGDSGSYVTKLQELLRAFGWDIEVDGSFGPATDAALREFQRAVGLDVDGYCGPMTWAALEDDDMAKNMATEVWHVDVENNSVGGSAGGYLKAIDSQVTGDTDYAGVGRPMGWRARLDWTGAKVTELNERMDKVQATLDAILRKLD